MLQRRQNERLNIHQQIVREIAVQIMSGEIEAGQILASEEIAAANLNVSRTAYREAVKVLVAKGFIESRPKVGTRVRAKSEWNMLDPEVIGWRVQLTDSADFLGDLFDFRMIIESEAAKLAARNARAEDIQALRSAVMQMAATDPTTQPNFEADLAFHKRILLASGNELLGSLGNIVESYLLRSFELSAIQPDNRTEAVPLHRKVLEQIENRDEENARAAMITLLTSARDDLESVLKPQNSNELQEAR